MAKTTKDALTGDPLVGAYFMVDFSGTTGYFMEVGGIGSETEVTEHKVTSSKSETIIRKVPGRLKWNDITLKRGITANLDFYEWRKQVETGLVDKARLNGSILMLDSTGTVVAQWDIEKAWPSKISGPSIKSDSSELGVEELTIVHEGIKRIK